MVRTAGLFQQNIRMKDRVAEVIFMFNPVDGYWYCDIEIDKRPALSTWRVVSGREVLPGLRAPDDVSKTGFGGLVYADPDI